MPDDKPYTAADQLYDLANHFVFRDWNYTRTTNIKRIQYKDDYKGYNTPSKRLKRGLKQGFGKDLIFKTSFWTTRKGTKWYRVPESIFWSVFWGVAVNLRDNHRPDGVLDGGSIITYWEETGEYLDLVQPSVGSLVAEFIRDEPENPWAVKLLTELERLRAVHVENWKNGLTDGEKHV